MSSILIIRRRAPIFNTYARMVAGVLALFTIYYGRFSKVENDEKRRKLLRSNEWKLMFDVVVRL